MIYGYARVSTQDQDLNLQLMALKEFGCEKVYSDKISGTTNQRRQLDKLREALEEGDHVVVWKLDRLFRSTIDALTQIENWSQQGILFTCTTQGISTADNSATGKLMRTILMAFADFERDLISERTKAGMAAAKAQGKHIGRRPKMDLEGVQLASRLLADGWSVSKIARKLSVSRATIYNHLDVRAVDIARDVN